MGSDNGEMKFALEKLKQAATFDPKKNPSSAYKDYAMDLEPSSMTTKLVEHKENENLENIVKVYFLGSGGVIDHNKDLLLSSSWWKQIKTPTGNNLLHVAVLYGKNDVVDLIVEHATEFLFSVNSNKDTALHLAARAAQISTVKKLLEAYTNYKRPEVTKGLLKYCGWEDSDDSSPGDERSNVSNVLEFIRSTNNQGNTMLHEAMMSGKSLDAARIFLYLEEYKTTDYRGESLSRSCYGYALKNTNNAMQSPLYLAVEAGYTGTVELILRNCSEIAKPNGLSPLVAAIMKRDKDMVSIILNKMREWIHIEDEHGRIPLHYAASEGYLKGVFDLLEKCESCSIQRDNYGYYPLHLASHGDHAEVVHKLLQKCPYPTEILDNYGRNILHIAAKSGKLEVLRYILQTRKLEMMINQKDKNGNTPLHLATICCQPKTVYALTWDNRVDLTLVNLENETALDILRALYQSEKLNSSFERRLTWVALRSAGAKASSSKGRTSNSKANEKSEEKDQSKKSDSQEPSNEGAEKSEKTKESEVRMPTTTEPKKMDPEPGEPLTTVSTLIITASVAACLAVPGEADGAAKNLNHFMFQFFIFSITISLFSSVCATILLFWRQLGLIQLTLWTSKIIMSLLGVALTTLCLAFVTGLYTVISELSWLATTFLVIGVIFVLIVCFLYLLLFLPSSSTNKPLRYISYYPFIFLASLAEP